MSGTVHALLLLLLTVTSTAAQGKYIFSNGIATAAQGLVNCITEAFSNEATSCLAVYSVKQINQYTAFWTRLSDCQ